MLAADGDEAEPTRPRDPPIPQVVWLSEADGTRPPDVLDDRAAKFLPEDNLIQANADFRVFTDMADYWCDEYGVERGNRRSSDVVHEWFEQALVETVIGCQALQGERRWSPKDMETMLVRGGAHRRCHAALPRRQRGQAHTRRQAGLPEGQGRIGPSRRGGRDPPRHGRAHAARTILV